MVNTREYEWADISLVVAGRDIKGFRGVKYSEKQEKEALYAKGNKAHCIQAGNIAYEGELTLTQSEYETLRLAMGGSILSGSLSMVVAYGNPSKGDVMVTDALSGCEFTEDATEWKQGDKYQEKSLPFVFLSKKSV
uniref:Putative XkdM-like protein n=1 Tax=Siphoviridae sp. ctJ0s2 TaxID=2827834 RepID=A0A8S5TE37_9CAUD|nr:MAG TPA: putative XkdM-like protein [Siphoviridae sp. ctJ0s2]